MDPSQYCLYNSCVGGLFNLDLRVPLHKPVASKCIGVAHDVDHRKRSSDVTTVYNSEALILTVIGIRRYAARVNGSGIRTASDAGNSLVSFRETYQDVLRDWSFRDGGCLHATKSLGDVRSSYEDIIPSVAVHRPFRL